MEILKHFGIETEITPENQAELIEQIEKKVIEAKLNDPEFYKSISLDKLDLEPVKLSVKAELSNKVKAALKSKKIEFKEDEDVIEKLNDFINPTHKAEDPNVDVLLGKLKEMETQLSSVETKYKTEYEQKISEYAKQMEDLTIDKTINQAVFSISDKVKGKPEAVALVVNNILNKKYSVHLDNGSVVLKQKSDPKFNAMKGNALLTLEAAIIDILEDADLLVKQTTSTQTVVIDAQTRTMSSTLQKIIEEENNRKSK
jgi:hypothetical protein